MVGSDEEPYFAHLKRHNTEQLRQIKRQVGAIEKEIMALIRADPELAHRFDILVSVPGVSAKPAMKAISAIMRKLVVLANALLRDDRKWTESFP